MPINILMPALSPTMEKGNLAKWLKKEGDAVKSGDVIAEIETDKATMEVEAVDEGTLGKILVPEGAQDVAVNAPIAILLTEGEGKDALKADRPRRSAPGPKRRNRHRPRPKSAAPAAKCRACQAPLPLQPRSATDANGGSRVFASPLAKRLARESGHRSRRWSRAPARMAAS